MTSLLPATPAHGAVMAALHASAFPPGETWGADAMTLQLELAGAFGILALTDASLPAGFVLARVAADEAEILTIAVRPGQRRHGIGALLLQAAESQAAQAGARTMFLEVAEANIAARALYERRGFRRVGRRRGYYAGGIDALVLRREFGAATPGAATAR